jgi:hypothetical protein
MNGAFRVGALVLMTFVAWSPESALARQYLKCLTKKVVIVDTPKGSTSSSVEESLDFWIDEAAKALMLADGMPLTVRRFDSHWISARRDDVSYEFDRQNGSLTYASSIRKDNAETITIGSGRCETAAGPAR